MTKQNEAYQYSSRESAQEYVDLLDSRTYYTDHGEMNRPQYTVRKTRGRDSYHVHAAYCYSAGTIHPKQDGPLGHGMDDHKRWVKTEGCE